MPRTNHFPFQKNLLAMAIGAALTPAWALDLVQEPPLPTSKSAFVAPNVIISVDDSGSMNYRLDRESGNDASNRTAPVNGVWPSDSRRINVLKHSLKQVFSDKDLIPDGKIRLAWQVMHANGNTNAEKNVNSSTLQVNSMRPLKGGISENGTHRKNFLDFATKLSPNNGTPSHTMFSQADAYMRSPLSSSGPWSSDPGKSTEYLGCRRNYHIMMTDGRWTGTATGGQQDGENLAASGKRQAYSITSPQTQIYRDTEESTLADWAFKSWAIPLQTSGLTDTDKLKPSLEYENAPALESFSKTKITAAYQGEPCKGYSNVCVSWRPNGKCREEERQCTGGWTSYPEKIETKSVNLEKYWNPKYNPAAWPHMVTYTIGFSESAIEWPGAPNIVAPTLTKAISEVDKGGYFGYDNGFVDLVTGWETWPTMNRSNTGNEAAGKEVRSLDLWHAAINGRGRFYPVTKGEDLENAFRAIIGKINEESTPLPDSIAGGGSTSGYNVSQNNAGLFASVYRPKDGWSGYITATRAIEPEEYACPTEADKNAKCIRFPDSISEWQGKSTADRLDELAPVSGRLDSRLVLSWSDETNQGIPFQWTDSNGYSTAQKKALLRPGSDDDITKPEWTQLGQNIVNYIRGDRSLEGTTADKPLRVRHSRQGDVVNSEIWYTGRPSGNHAMDYSAFVKAQKDRTPMLYVGGNDGMLHGFSAKDGKELIAYVPRGVVGGLKDLTDKDYQHRYYVDGSPMTGDVRVGATWKTLLVGALGAGGKGYFVLDVTNPAGFGATATAASALVTLDRTRGNEEASPCDALSSTAQTTCNAAKVEVENKDIGNIVAQPGRNPTNLQEATQITRMNNDRWAVVMGNGYNSANQRPVLLVQYLDGDKALVRIQATTAAKGIGNATDNGLASPALIDLNGDGKTDVVYAGDNLGNLWKFDLTSDSDNAWTVAFGYDKPLFTARGPAKLNDTARPQVQPITAPPIVRANDRTMALDAKTTVSIGGLMVAFGTGRNVTANDRRTDITQNVQTLYSVLDNTRYRMKTGKTHLEVHPGEGSCSSAPSTCIPAPAPVGTMADNDKPLAQQTIATVSGNFATVAATKELSKETWKNYKGWYLDLPFTGERLLKPMQFFDGSNILAVYTESPSGTKHIENDNINESCVPVKVDTSAGSQFRTLINIMDGKIPSVQLVDTNGDGVYNAKDQKVARALVNTGTPVLITQRDRIVDRTGGGGADDGTAQNILNRMPEQSMRPSWRQLQ